MDLSYFYIRSGMGTIQHGMAQCVAAVTRDAVQYGALRRRFSCENGEVYMAPCRAVPSRVRCERTLQQRSCCCHLANGSIQNVI